MLTFFLAAVLPWLYWDQGASTADAVKQAGIDRLYVPAEQEAAWKAAGFDARAFDAAKFVKLPAPGVQYRADVASATNVPWVDANGWRFERGGARAYYYDVPWRKAALAAAEAYAYGADAVLHPEARDLPAFGRMLAFLRGMESTELPALANIGIIDDGARETGEVLNLLTRRNLLARVVTAPDPKYELNVRIGSKEYPKAQAADPSAFASLIRRKLTDEKRLLRLYGSDVVLGRVTGNATRVRVHLINYGGGKVEGLRVRVRGAYAQGALAAFGVKGAALIAYNTADDGTEFTIPEMDVYAVVDLKK
ncbi:MAG: hypothetical protein DMG58_32780 [Acidobacteria bacterium]|nr:MAG: hypothetical protein DMG58_32780 [Acidobacteriota bacterium]